MEAWCSLCKSNTSIAIHFYQSAPKTEKEPESAVEKQQGKRLKAGQIWANIFTKTKLGFVKTDHWSVFRAQHWVTDLTSLDRPIHRSEIYIVVIIEAHSQWMLNVTATFLLTFVSDDVYNDQNIQTWLRLSGFCQDFSMNFFTTMLHFM